MRQQFVCLSALPGKPVAHNLGLLCLNDGLLWGIVAQYFWLLGFPGRVLERNVIGSTALAPSVSESWRRSEVLGYRQQILGSPHTALHRVHVSYCQYYWVTKMTWI